MFVYSIKLFGSNWVKALKFFLYYLVILGVCFALLLPCFYAFKDLIIESFKDNNVLNAFNGVFQGALGLGLHNLIQVSYLTLVKAFSLDLGIAIYGLIIIFVVAPILLNIGKYTFCEMLYSYMTSKNNIGFFNAFFRGLRKSVFFALIKMIYNVLFIALTLVAVYGIGMIEDAFFVTYFLPIVEFVVLVLLFTLNSLTVLGWLPSIIVFDCNVFVGFRKGAKAVGRHFWGTFGTTIAYFIIFWICVMVFGIYTLVVLIPLMTALLCVYNMVMFFSSQGMRFYFTKTQILTPKKLEEVDNINKTAFIL